MIDFRFYDFFLQNAAYLTKKIGPKKDRRVRKIEVPTDSVPKFQLGDTVADVQQRREEREAREREEEAQKHWEEEARREEERREDTLSREWQKNMQGQTQLTQK